MNEDVPSHAPPETLIALVIFTLVSLGLGYAANVMASRGRFLRKYFLGNRSLGPFAIALTAAVMSGGTFMGYPSLIYSFGWVVALWICSYMVFPLTVLGGLGKRVGQLSRRTGAITLPDLFRERYGSEPLGLVTSLVILFFLTCNLIPQYKAGALIVKLVTPEGAVAAFQGAAGGLLGGMDPGYLLGLLVFTVTVVAYTTYGGFLAAVWTDVFQSLIMAVGVIILLPLALAAAGGLHAGTLAGVAQTGDPGFAFGPGAGGVFFPITLAISFFFMWAITGMGQPSTLVRLMAFRDSKTLKISIVYLTIYNLIVYVPLIFIFVAARAVLPDLTATGQSDEVMPRLVISLANPYVAGLILAAPYGAVMSTVSAFLLIVSSGLVRDIYQRFLRPSATESEIARASYLGTLAVGVVAGILALNPPDYLQIIIVFSSTGMAAAFLVPALMGCYWRRATAAGALSAMLAGVGVTLALYAVGIYMASRGWKNPIYTGSKTTPYFLFGFDPCVWAILSSLAAGILVSLATRPPDPKLVSFLFDGDPTEPLARPAAAPAAESPNPIPPQPLPSDSGPKPETNPEPGSRSD